MQKLKTLRTRWQRDSEKQENDNLYSETASQTIQQWVMLQSAFEWQLQKTEGLFSPPRRAALAELQARLERFAVWQASNAKSHSIHPEHPEEAE